MLTFSGITATMNLSPYECSEMQFVVVRLLKNDNSPVDFTFSGGILFEDATCNGMTMFLIFFYVIILTSIVWRNFSLGNFLLIHPNGEGGGREGKGLRLF